MDTLQISKANALKAFNDTDASGKTLLSNLFGKKVFNLKITDRVKSFEDACEETGEDPNDPKFNSGDPYYDSIHRLEVWAKALNEGVILSYKNPDQKKWYPVHIYGPSGFRFHASYYGSTITYSAGGSRLCLVSEPLANYMGTQCISDYQNIYN